VRDDDGQVGSSSRADFDLRALADHRQAVRRATYWRQIKGDRRSRRGFHQTRVDSQMDLNSTPSIGVMKTDDRPRRLSRQAAFFQQRATMWWSTTLSLPAAGYPGADATRHC